MAIHHLIMDGWSLEIVFRDLADAYEALGEATAKCADEQYDFQQRCFGWWWRLLSVPCAFKATVEWEDRAMASWIRRARRRPSVLGWPAQGLGRPRFVEGSGRW